MTAPTKPPDYPLTDKPHDEPLPKAQRDATAAELEAASVKRAAVAETKAEQLHREALAKRDPATLTAAEREILARQPAPPELSAAEYDALARRDPSTLTALERAQLARRGQPHGNPDADALAARDRVRVAVLNADDAARFALLIGVDGRTTAIARELEGDAAVLEQLAAQMRLDARDLRVATPAQTTVLDVAVARLRAFAAQLVMLCASRDVPLPQIPTLPAAPHVPPPRA